MSEQNETGSAQVHRPSVVVDQASMTYRVRSADAMHSSGGLRGRLRAARGVRTTEVQALQPLSFMVERGESVGVIGTNGSGKSTLMKLITGQMHPTSGRVYATTTPVMLGVNAALVRQVSGEDNIRLGCLAMGMTTAEAEAKRLADEAAATERRRTMAELAEGFEKAVGGIVGMVSASATGLQATAATMTRPVKKSDQ